MPEPDYERVDFDKYFLRWDSVMFYPNPSNRHVVLYEHSGDGGVIPCHRHITCGALVNARSKYPPKVCPGCKIDTSTEYVDEEELQEVMNKFANRKTAKGELWLP